MFAEHDVVFRQPGEMEELADTILCAEVDEQQIGQEWSKVPPSWMASSPWACERNRVSSKKAARVLCARVADNPISTTLHFSSSSRGKILQYIKKMSSLSISPQKH